MHTPRGTPYATLRALALNGHAPTRAECELAETEARRRHALAQREFATLDLLICRALWSAWRNLRAQMRAIDAMLDHPTIED